MNNKLDRSPIGATIFSFKLFRKKEKKKMKRSDMPLER